MGEIQKPPSPETVLDWIEQINENEQSLNSWEKGFMRSITNQTFNQTRRKFSPLQIQAIEKIYCSRIPFRVWKKEKENG